MTSGTHEIKRSTFFEILGECYEFFCKKKSVLKLQKNNFTEKFVVDVYESGQIKKNSDGIAKTKNHLF